MTNKGRINSLLNSADKLADFLLESPCEHCYYFQDNNCNLPAVDIDMSDLCVDGVKKWLNSDVDKTIR